MNERDLKVLYCLTKWPRAPSREICSAISIKDPTFSSMRKRYLTSGVMRFERAIDPFVMGFKIRGVEYGMLRRDLDEGGARELFLSTAKELGSIFIFETDGNAFYLMVLSPTYTDYNNLISKCRLRGEDEGVSGIYSSGEYFDEVRSNIIHNLGDYSGVLRYHFGTEVEAPALSVYENPLSNHPNPNLEVKGPIFRILPLLVAVPPLGDREISEKLGLSRQKVGQTRLLLEREGMLFKSYVLNMNSFGLKIRAHFVVEYRKDVGMDSIIQYEEELKRRMNPVFWHSSGSRSNFLFYFRDIGEYKEFINTLYEIVEDSPVERVKGTPLSIEGTSTTSYYIGQRSGRETRHGWINDQRISRVGV